MIDLPPRVEAIVASDPSLEPFRELYEQWPVLSEGDDYSKVLRSTAIIGDILERLLLLYFREGKTAKNLLKSPINDIFDRARLAYCLCMMNTETLNQLHLVIEIRNHFGHSKAMSFENEIVQKTFESFQSRLPNLATEQSASLTFGWITYLDLVMTVTDRLLAYENKIQEHVVTAVTDTNTTSGRQP